MAGGSLVQLVVQLALQILLARWFGAGNEMDAYVAAMALPTAASSLLHAVVAAAVVPAMAESGQRAGRDEACRLGTTLTLAMSLGLAALATATMAAAPALVSLLQPGFSAAEQQRTATLLRWLAWLVATNGLIALLQAWHQWLGRFAAPAVASVIGVGAALAWCVWRAPVIGIVAVAQGTLVGSSVTTGMLLGSLTLGGAWRGPLVSGRPLARLMAAAAPLVAISLVAQLDPLADRFFGSWLPEGSVSQLGYAARIVAALQMLTVSSLSVAVFPRFAQYAAADSRDELRSEIQRALRFVVLWLAPLAVALGAFGRPLVRDLLQRGAFGPDDTRAVAAVLAASLGAIAAMSLGEFLSKALYAMGLTRLPLAMTVAGIGLSLALKALFVSRLGLLALPLSTSIGTTLIAYLLWRAVGQRLGSPAPAGIGRTLACAIAGSLVAAAVAAAVLTLDAPLSAIAAGAAGLVAYVATIALLREPTLREIWSRSPEPGSSTA